nr:suppressor of cytokine signaling 2 [Nothobranchius furzeri]XP_015818545.2 suppressor of cytokine signaling 2 [Nothobranchius furzeri]XP_015818553.2 suppressor of cytokine signaling 2 [Nothobranchius furzeri]XP_054595929.1 suppressor of cytokine signaling 2 [Nothobranchius furzeri]
MTCQSSEAIEDERRASGSSTGICTVESDESGMASTMKDLRNTGWYWGGLTANGAREVLQDWCEGAFLLRDSSQRDFLFTISAMTSAGPTNLRIEYKHGKFKLDSVVLIKPKLKQFSSVVHLVEHYVQLSRTSEASPAPVLGPPNRTVQLLLTKPVYMAVPSLQHLCRVAVNRTSQQVQNLPVPNRLKDYLADYVYSV